VNVETSESLMIIHVSALSVSVLLSAIDCCRSCSASDLLC